MSLLVSQIRPFWTYGINEVNGRSLGNLISWIDSKKDYVLYDPIEINSFQLYITDYQSVIKSIAFDINRFGTAAFESMNDIYYSPGFPDSNAWKCIKAYYAAYYSVQAILRMLGESCTNFERVTLQRVEKIADAYGSQNGVNITGGYYSCILDHANHKLNCSKISTTGVKGSHEQLWERFLLKLREIIAAVSLNNTLAGQQVLLTLLQLKDNLTYMGCNGGNWLSKIRNDISYKQQYGLWHPYSDSENYYSDFEVQLNAWKAKADDIPIGIYQGRSLLRFVSTCVFLVALFKDLALDMSERCPKGHSFLAGQALAFYNRANGVN